LHYEPLTGYFTWIKPKQVRRINGIAGCVDKNGYRLIGINGKLYYAHRLVYLYIKGEFNLYISHPLIGIFSKTNANKPTLVINSHTLVSVVFLV
jgi:hypothetical protein